MQQHPSVVDSVFSSFCEKAQMLETEEEVEAFSASGGVKQLVMLCRGNRNPDVLVNALGAIGCVVSLSEKAAEEVAEEGGTKTIMDIVTLAFEDFSKPLLKSDGACFGNASRGTMMHLLETSLFALGATTERLRQANATVGLREGFVSMLMQCGGAVSLSSNGGAIPIRRAGNVERGANEEDGEGTAEVFPAEIQQNAFWILQSVLGYQSMGHFHSSSVPEVLSKACGGLERLNDLCNGIGMGKTVDEGRRARRMSVSLRQAAASVLCSALRVVSRSRHSALHAAERKSLQSRIAMLNTKRALETVQEFLWDCNDFDEVIKEETWVPRKGVQVEAKIGTDGSYRIGVVVKLPRHQKWCHVYDESAGRLIRKVPISHIRRPQERPAANVHARRSSESASRLAAPPKATVAQVLCDIASAINWLESQTPLWKRSHGRALLLSRLFSRQDHHLDIDVKRTMHKPILSSLVGLGFMEKALLDSGVYLDGASVLDQDVSMRHVRSMMSNFFEALPGEPANALLVLCYSGKGSVGSGNWMLGDGNELTIRDVLRSWDASSARLRGGMLMLLLDSCGSGAWSRKVREEGRTDVVVQACCRPFEVSVPNRFWFKWFRHQQNEGREEDTESTRKETEVHPKTILCGDFRAGACRRGSQCSHAHGMEELILQSEELSEKNYGDNAHGMNPEVYAPWSVQDSKAIHFTANHLISNGSSGHGSKGTEGGSLYLLC